MSGVLVRTIAVLGTILSATFAQAADTIGGCEMSGSKGDLAVTSPAQPGEITVAVSLPAPTWWNGESPETIRDGYEYCLAAAVAWHAGYDRLHVVTVPWSGLLAGRANGYDLALSEIVVTNELRAVAEVSVPYFALGYGVLVKSSRHFEESSIGAAKIGVQKGTTAAGFVASRLKPGSVKVFATETELFAALDSGTIDAAVADTEIALAQEAQKKGSLAVVGQYDAGQAYGALYPKGSANAAAFDKILAALQADGTLAALAVKYLAPVLGRDPSTIPAFKP